MLLAVALLLNITARAQSQYMRGYPQADANLDLKQGFLSPPKGYGNVPFYWWSGDHLTRERLAAQLDILSESATDGFAISYIHTDPKTDTLFNGKKYGLYGRTEPGEPAVFSDEWWDIWTWFSGECAKRGVAAGLDDYTVGWIGNGYYPDEIEHREQFQNYPGHLTIKKIPVKRGKAECIAVPENMLAAVVWPEGERVDHLVKGGCLDWQPQRDGVLYLISTEHSYILHPDYGKALVEVYFDRFEQKMTPQQREGMNYFFQDELSYPIDMLSWSKDFAEQFMQRKGYDVVPLLPALVDDIGAITPKVRLDYAEVLTDLAEERYYKPIYEWHAKRGLIYGSDNLGRGKDPLAYVDYFRANSWYTAPGNDAPSRGSSFLQTKVSSSIAHLYHRPRTWLEAFHSMGWGSSGEWLTEQIDHHFMAGGNLVCMHGLYYSTHGGWWEWAPPCFHFRMPYWPHMKGWLKYTERMSYILSQGSHICDIAVVYPTESMQAYKDATAEGAFATAMRLSDSGLDYDFIDFRSLRDAHIKDGRIYMGDESYRVIVISDMQAMHHSSLEKLRDFYRAGGIVLSTGALPKASSRKGEGDSAVDEILRELFSMTGSETSGKVSLQTKVQTSSQGGVAMWVADGAVESVIPKYILPDFIPGQKGGKVLHRRIGERDVYMVMNVEKGSECFFRAKGRVELWDAATATIEPLPISRQDENGTWIRMNKEYDNSYLIVFSEGEPERSTRHYGQSTPRHTMPIEGAWQVELLPTLDNRWGDYRLPATEEMIAAEARTFDYKAHEWSEWRSGGIYGYGEQAILEWGGKSEEYSFSWQYGVWGEPGSQGYHGLKSKVSDGFFILDKGKRQRFSTYVYVPKTDNYRVEQIYTPADRLFIDGKQVTEIQNTGLSLKNITSGVVRLKRGWHSMVVEYDKCAPKKVDVRVGVMRDYRDRGAVVLIPEREPAPVKPSIYGERVAMLWSGSNHLKYDPYGGKYPLWDYRFVSAPGMQRLEFELYGELTQVSVKGQSLKIEALGEGAERGARRYAVSMPSTVERAEQVSFSVKVDEGCQGTAAIAAPVKISTAKGLLEAGDWSQTGALLHYSGGMRYSRNITLPEGITPNRVMLNLGDVVATCEVSVNGVKVGEKMSPPYSFDITSQLKAGENRVEVVVYSTLANHYQVQPTPYRGSPKAGIIGPVSVEVY